MCTVCLICVFCVLCYMLHMSLGDVQRGEGGEGRGTLFTINCTFLETAKQEHVLSVFSVLSIKVMLTFARTKI